MVVTRPFASVDVSCVENATGRSAPTRCVSRRASTVTT